jgi:hypothetical protein
MTFRYAGTNGGDHQLYYDERERMRGRSSNSQNYNRREQAPPSPRYGGPPPIDTRYRDGYRNERHTVDRERFPKYNEDRDDFEEDIEQQPSYHLSRRDRMRERERERERGLSSPPQNRRLMRFSEDRQMGASPRYQRAGRKYFFFYDNAFKNNFKKLKNAKILT